MIHELPITFFTINVLVLAVAIARQVERRWPIEPLRQLDVNADWKVTGVNLGLTALMGPVTLPCSAAIVNLMGGGFIHLRADGAWYVVSLAGYVIAADLTKYWYHRLEHTIPFLWAMHSFQHSAEAITFFTGGRHYWLERVLAGAFFPILPILFDMPVSIAAIVGFIFFLPDSCAHLNVRVSMKRAITWVNNPQWHRIHHSMLPEHHDRNFASLLPLWDILFRVIDSIVWPLRHHLPRLRSREA
jgi:sterol desaturase/sphingolipid hydroxylase (fatty acid hydroxylase superfamily)